MPPPGFRQGPLTVAAVTTRTADVGRRSLALMPPPPPAPWEPAPSDIHWRLAWAVVALQGSLQLGWIIYRAYQPAMLSGHGFAGLLFPFALLPGFLGLFTEPISGAVSDRWAASARGRLLPLTVSVLVAGLIFLSVVGLLQRGIGAGNVLLPGLMLAWMVAVQSSSSPGLALLNEAVSLRNLPRVAALVTLVQGLIGAFSDRLAEGALRLGPTFTFLLGAAVLALGLCVLRAVPATPAASPLPPPRPCPPLPLGRCLPLLLIGLAVGGFAQVLLDLLPRVQPLAAQGSWQPGLAPVVLLCSALASPWAGKLVILWGRRGALLGGMAGLGVALAVALLLPSAFAPPLLPLLGLIHSLVATSLTALSLAALPPEWGGLGAGLVLGGYGLAASFCLLRFGAVGNPGVTAVLMVLACSGALALAGCLLLDRCRPSADARA